MSSSPEPRLSPLGPNDDPRLAELFAKGLRGPDGTPLNIFATLGHHPDLLRRWLVFASHVLSKNSLNERDRELLILRTGWNCASRYEWCQHVEIALRCGVTQAEIDAVREGSSDPVWADEDRLLLVAADELHERQTLTDGTWAGLAVRYSPAQILDVIATVGNYHVVAMFLNATRVALDAGIPDSF